jgi:hypothetical protein
MSGGLEHYNCSVSKIMNKAGIIPPPEGKGTFVHDGSEYSTGIETLESALYDECKIVLDKCYYTFFSDTIIPTGQRMFVHEIALTFLGLSYKSDRVLSDAISDLFSAKLIYVPVGENASFECRAVECFADLTYHVTLKRSLREFILIPALGSFKVGLLFKNSPSVTGYTIRVNLFGVTERAE